MWLPRSALQVRELHQFAQGILDEIADGRFVAVDEAFPAAFDYGREDTQGLVVEIDALPMPPTEPDLLGVRTGRQFLCEQPRGSSEVQNRSGHAEIVVGRNLGERSGVGVDQGQSIAQMQAIEDADQLPCFVGTATIRLRYSRCYKGSRLNKCRGWVCRVELGGCG